MRPVRWRVPCRPKPTNILSCPRDRRARSCRRTRPFDSSRRFASLPSRVPPGAGQPIAPSAAKIESPRTRLYIGYEEGACSDLEDLRTGESIRELEQWTTTWGRVLIGSVVDRTYPKPGCGGRPDLIENAVIFKPKGTHSDVMDLFPGDIFMPHLFLR